jgi:hypothetical protein
MEAECARLIEQDVDRHWYLMREDAVKRVDARVCERQPDF